MPSPYTPHRYKPLSHHTAHTTSMFRTHRHNSCSSNHGQEIKWAPAHKCSDCRSSKFWCCKVYNEASFSRCFYSGRSLSRSRLVSLCRRRFLAWGGLLCTWIWSHWWLLGWQLRWLAAIAPAFLVALAVTLRLAAIASLVTWIHHYLSRQWSLIPQ